MCSENIGKLLYILKYCIFSIAFFQLHFFRKPISSHNFQAMKLKIGIYHLYHGLQKRYLWNFAIMAKRKKFDRMMKNGYYQCIWHGLIVFSANFHIFFLNFKKLAIFWQFFGQRSGQNLRNRFLPEYTVGVSSRRLKI